MLGKIFNKGKKKEFYLAIDETKENVSAVIDETKETISDVADTVSETVTEVVSETVSKVTDVIESAPSPEAIVEAVAKPKSTSSKKTTKGKSQTATEQKSVKKPAATVSSGASSWEEPFWVKAMYNQAPSSSTNGEKAEKTFATDYLIVQSTSRRRPGPSLNKFKEMVKKNRF